jgi:hypothetical protein
MIRGLREGREPTRPRAVRAEFSDEEWRLVSEIDIVHMESPSPLNPIRGGQAAAEPVA